MTLRSCLRWQLTGRIFKTVGLRWVPTGKIFTSSTTKVYSEPLNGSNEDITNPYECEQTLNVSVGTLDLRTDHPARTSLWKSVGIKSLLNVVSIIAALIDVNAAQSKVNAAEGVNAASEEVSTTELVSTAYIKEFDLLKWDQQVVSELVALRNFARRHGSRFCTHGGCIQSSHAQTEFGGNAATKKTQRNLLKQQYENFTAPSSEMLDQTFDRLQKLVSQLELLDEKLSQEDVN
ncbi:hypothetical protein Tco_0987018 [Tanacetum coccineum]